MTADQTDPQLHGMAADRQTVPAGVGQRHGLGARVVDLRLKRQNQNAPAGDDPALDLDEPAAVGAGREMMSEEPHGRPLHFLELRGIGVAHVLVHPAPVPNHDRELLWACFANRVSCHGRIISVESAEGYRLPG